MFLLPRYLCIWTSWIVYLQFGRLVTTPPKFSRTQEVCCPRTKNSTISGGRRLSLAADPLSPCYFSHLTSQPVWPAGAKDCAHTRRLPPFLPLYSTAQHTENIHDNSSAPRPPVQVTCYFPTHNTSSQVCDIKHKQTVSSNAPLYRKFDLCKVNC